MSEYLLPVLLAIRPRRAAGLIPSVVAWWRPLLMVAAVGIAAAVFAHRSAVDTTVAHLPPTVSEDQAVQVRQWLDEDLPARLAILPFRAALENALSALVLLAFARAFTGRPAGSFRGFFVLATAASFIPLVGQSLSALWHQIAGGGTAPFLATPLSAAWFLPDTGDYRFTVLLTSANLITLWYVGSVTAGVAVLCRCKAWKAVLVAVAAWTVTAASSITVLSLLRNAFQFRL